MKQGEEEEEQGEKIEELEVREVKDNLGLKVKEKLKGKVE